MLLGLTLLGTTMPAAAESKIGVVDSQRIFAEYGKAREAENVFQAEMQAWATELEGMEATLVQLQEQIRAQSLLLSQEKLDKYITPCTRVACNAFTEPSGFRPTILSKPI